MAAGPSIPTSVSSAPSAAGHGPPGAAPAAADLTFEFWNDRCYQSFLPGDLDVLRGKFHEKPRPAEVQLGGGKYLVQHFEQLEEGRSVQVNARTQFERPVRLRPPYQLPGAPAAKLPDGPFHFEFEDDRSTWRPYSSWLQRELEQVVRCAPPPAQFFFVEEGKAYFLLGLDSLAKGTPELLQVNCRTQHMRRVVMMPGVPHAQAGPPPPPPQGRGNGLLSRLVGGAGGGGAASSSASARRSHHGHPASNGAWSNASHVDASAPFTLSSAIFRLNPAAARFTCGGPDKVQPLSQDAHEVLCGAWRSDPRPEQVKLPSGDLVVGFHDLEVGGATMHCAPPSSSHHLGPFSIPSMGRHHRSSSAAVPMELHLPMPQPGSVVLPDSLDVETSQSPMAYGRFLSNAEVAQLPSRGAEANKCSICLSEMEPSGDDSDPDITMVPVDGNSNNVPQDGGPVFELQCGHAYHTECINQWFNQRRRCPQCQKDFGKVIGDQPRVGTLQWHLEPFSLPGHNTRETIVIQFEFPAGTTEQGTKYDGRKPKGYLPGNAQGIVLLELFKIAFRRCVMFGIGNSMTFGTFRPTFNIHIKTSTHRGTTGHGYPDENYFKRALEELKGNGVTIADLPK